MVLLLASIALFAPQVAPRPVSLLPRDAGVYHVATGTWSRPSRPGRRRPPTAAALGPDVLYANSTGAGFTGTTPPGFELVDVGRVPGTTSTPPGSADSYLVNGFQIAYCTEQVTSALDARVRFFERYAACSDTAVFAPPVADFQFNGVLPGSGTAGVQSCWTVTIDLEGSAFAFELGADGADGAFDGNPATDSFGVGLSGDFAPVFATGGPGQDNSVWYEDPAGVLSNCAISGASPSGPALVLYGDTDQELLGSESCVSGVNSSGQPGTLSIYGSDTAQDQDVVLVARSIGGGPGLFFFGTQLLAMGPDFGEGRRCVGGSIARVYPIATVPAHGSTTRSLDFAAGYASNIVSGASLTFQFWHRDAMAGDLDGDGTAEGFNVSNARTVTFQ